MTNTRRRDPRLNEAYSVWVRSVGRIQNEGLHRTFDLGLKGCSFASRTPYGLGTRVKLAVAVERKVLAVEGRIVRETGESSGGYIVGVEFERFGTQAKERIESLFMLESISHKDEEEFTAMGLNAAG